MRFYDKVKALCVKNGIPITVLASELGMARSTTTNWKTMQTLPHITTIKKIADYFGVPPEYFLDEVPAGSDVHSSGDLSRFGIAPVERKTVPLLGDISCGKPIFAEEVRDCFVEAGGELHADFCLRAKGDSMIGARIRSGDLVFIRRQTTVASGEIAAVIINDEATLKRVYYYPESQKLVLTAENPAYEPFVYTGAELENIRIIGKAVAFQSKL